MLELTVAPATVTAQALADAQSLPYKFTEAILADLRRAGLVRSQRGAEGGYTLSRPATEISVGDVLRAVDGPLAGAVRRVLDETSLAQVATGDLPTHVRELLDSPDAWKPR